MRNESRNGASLFRSFIMQTVMYPDQIFYFSLFYIRESTTNTPSDWQLAVLSKSLVETLKHIRERLYNFTADTECFIVDRNQEPVAVFDSFNHLAEKSGL